MSQVVEIGNAILTLVKDTLFPLYLQYQQSKQAGTRDLSWAMELRQNNPLLAAQLAQMMNPDPLAAQIPLIIANTAQQAGAAAFGAGLRTRAMAGQYPGGEVSPTSSPATSAPTANSLGGSPATPAKPSASMLARKPSGSGRQSNSQQPAPKATPQGPSTLSELLAASKER